MAWAGGSNLKVKQRNMKHASWKNNETTFRYKLKFTWGRWETYVLLNSARTHWAISAFRNAMHMSWNKNRSTSWSKSYFMTCYIKAPSCTHMYLYKKKLQINTQIAILEVHENPALDCCRCVCIFFDKHGDDPAAFCPHLRQRPIGPWQQVTHHLLHHRGIS